MKCLVLFLLLYQIGFSQVGINTTNPTATLDVNGNFKIRTTTQETDNGVLKDSILVISKTGIVNRVPGKEILNASLPTIVKASVNTGGNVVHALVGGVANIDFDTKEIDNNNEFDLTTNTYTAKQDGIYTISVQIRINSIISANTNFGIGIYKNGALVAEQSYLSIVVLGTDVSSPFRSVSTTIDLTSNDTIEFKVSTTLLNVNILGNTTETFCSIYQIR